MQAWVLEVLGVGFRDWGLRDLGLWAFDRWDLGDFEVVRVEVSGCLSWVLCRLCGF